MEPLGQEVGPTVIGIRGGGRAIGDRIAERHDRPGVGRGVDHDPAQEDPGLDRLRRLELDVAREVAFAGDVGCLHALVVPGRGRRDLGEEQADGDAAEGRDGEVQGVTDHRRARRDRSRGLTAEGQRAVGAGHDRDAVVGQSDMGGADDQRA
jgi:hypothetical protein